MKLLVIQKFHIFPILLGMLFSTSKFVQGYHNTPEGDKDVDIQSALIAVTLRLPVECPIVLIFDDEMPFLSASRELMRRVHENWRLFTMLNLSEKNLPILMQKYGANSSTEILQEALFALYRQSSCYIFHVWIKDPRILYPEISVKYHPGWRHTDYVIIMTHHITKRYKLLIGLRFWRHIPNIIGLKRNEDEDNHHFFEPSVNIFTVIPYYSGGRRKSQEIDTWLVEKKQFRKNNALFFDKFKNFHNASLVLGVVWKEPFFIWGNIQDPYLDGLDWRLFVFCKEKLNFTFTFTNVDSVGRNVGNDTWTGMLGLLADGLVDVGTGGISVTSERRRYFDFCRTYYTDSFNFIAPINRAENTALDTFLKPFKTEVWIATFVSAFVGVVTLKLIALIENKTVQKEFFDVHFTSLSNNFGFLITLFCQKSYRYVPKGRACQCIHMGLVLMIVLLGMAFSSCLISVLLSFKVLPIADQVDDILTSNLPIFLKDYGGHLNEFMEYSTNPTLQKIYQKGKFVSYVDSFDAMDEVVKGKAIYIDSKVKLEFSGKYLYSEKRGRGMKFHISSDSLLEFDNLGWAVAQNWPFIPKLDAIITRAVESGIVQHWINQFRKGKFGKSKEAWKIPSGKGFPLMEKQKRTLDINIRRSEKNQFVSLSAMHVKGIYALYVAGMGIATLVFIAECTFGITCAVWKLAYNKRIKNRTVTKEHQRKIKITKSKNDKINKSLTDNSKDNPKKCKPRKLQKCKIIKVKSSKPQMPPLIWNDFAHLQNKML